MKPIIHIGYPKTGTTWFQKNYFPNIRNATYIPRNVTVDDFTKDYNINFNYKKVQNKYHDISSELLILSLEDLSGNINNIGINRYATKETAYRLQSVFPNAKIIIFIRNQPDIIASIYMQYVKGGGTYGINRYLNDKHIIYPDNLISFAFEHFEYHNIIQLYKSIFGNNNVNIFFYEDFYENNKAFLSNFNQIFDFKVDVDNLNYEKINKNYRSLILVFAKFFNLFTCQKRFNKYYFFHIPKWYYFSRTILKYLNKYPIFGKHLDTHKILGKKNMEIINNYYKQSNYNLINIHNIQKIKKYSYPL